MDPKHSPKRQLDLLDLPPEVRHQIYNYLFCHKPSPIALGHEVASSKWEAWAVNDEPSDPTFYTGLFRVNKAISHDALQFAYSTNSFRLNADLETFTKLGPTSLASIKALSVFNNVWSSSAYARRVWETLGERCSGLELLIVQPASHVLFRAIPYVKEFVASIPPGQERPELVLDLNVWDRHFSFDLPDREYRRSLEELKGADTSVDDEWNEFMSPHRMIMRMPKHVKQIQFVLDVSLGAVQALDEVLKESTGLKFVRTKDPPTSGGHHLGGRRTRHCYVWTESGG